MEFTSDEEPQFVHKRSIELPASQEELDELAMIADNLLEYGYSMYGSEIVRSNALGSLVVQSSFSEIGDENARNATLRILGPEIAGQETNTLADFYFNEDQLAPDIEMDLDNAKNARDVLLSLITEGKLDKTETSIALYCIQRCAEKIENCILWYDTRASLLETITEHVASETEEYVLVKNYTSTSDADIEINISSVNPSNPLRGNEYPRLVIDLENNLTGYRIRILQDYQGGYVAQEDHNRNQNELDVFHPELYHVQQVRSALTSELLKFSANTNESDHAMESTDVPYSDLLEAARYALIEYVSLPPEKRKTTLIKLEEAAEALSQDFESHYHLIRGVHGDGELRSVNIAINPNTSFGSRNMLTITSPYAYSIDEEKNNYKYIELDDTKPLLIEYSHIYSWFFQNNDKQDIDLFLVTHANKLTLGRKLLLPMSRLIVVAFAPLNN
jgi:hypothetical protein